MTKSLLETARGVPPVRKQRNLFDQVELEALAVAWLKGELTTSQVQKTLNRVGSTAYGLLANALRRAVIGGRLKIK